MLTLSRGEWNDFHSSFRLRALRYLRRSRDQILSNLVTAELGDEKTLIGSGEENIVCYWVLCRLGLLFYMACLSYLFWMCFKDLVIKLNRKLKTEPGVSGNIFYQGPWFQSVSYGIHRYDVKKLILSKYSLSISPAQVKTNWTFYLVLELDLFPLKRRNRATGSNKCSESFYPLLT